MPQVARSSWALLAVLFLINVLNFADRSLPSIVGQQIKEDLHLSDTSLGLLHGLVFTLIYSLAGLPAGRLADRVSRPRIIAVTVVIWGITTSLGGLARSFWVLAATRMGLAVGEAALHPAATSLIAGRFPDNRRKTALAIYLMGSSVGASLGVIFGGWIAEAIGWRKLFMIMGLPSVVLALVMFAFTDRREESGEPAPTSSWRDALQEVRSSPAFRHVAVAASLFIFAATSIYGFGPLYLIRHFGLTVREAGLAFGILMGVSGIFGVLAGGLLTDWLGRRDPRLVAWVPAAGLIVAAPLLVLAWIMPSATLCVALLPVPSFLMNTYLGPAFGLAQGAVSERNRGFAVSVLTFSMYAVGGSLGPVITGMISDAALPAFGTRSLALALGIVSVALAWSAVHFWLAGRHIGRAPSSSNEMAAKAAVTERGVPAI